MREGIFTSENRIAWERIDFRRLRNLINRLPAAKFRVMQAMSEATRRTAVISGMPRGGGVGNPVESGAMRVELAKGALKNIEDEIEAARAVLKPRIDALDTPLCKMVMTMRYMEGHSVRDIAYGLNYSEQHIFRIVARTEKKLNKDESCESL